MILQYLVKCFELLTVTFQTQSKIDAMHIRDQQVLIAADYWVGADQDRLGCLNKRLFCMQRTMLV